MDEYGLLFYFSEDFTEPDVAALRQAITDLALASRWTDQPPQFIDQISDADEFVRTVGGFLRLPPPNDTGDRDAEKAYYEDVARLVNALSIFSAETGCEFEFELGGTYVGEIAKGQPDKLLAVGLLEEWRNNL